MYEPPQWIHVSILSPYSYSRAVAQLNFPHILRLNESLPIKPDFNMQCLVPQDCSICSAQGGENDIRFYPCHWDSPYGYWICSSCCHDVRQIQLPSSTPWTSMSHNRNSCGVQGDGTALRTTSQSENQKPDTRCYIQWSYSQTRFRCGKTRLFVNSDEIRAWRSSVLLLHLYFVTVKAFVKHETWNIINFSIEYMSDGN